MRMLRENVLRWVGLLICVASFVQAAPFAKTIKFRQPDGSQIQLRGKGDDFQAVFETQDGYTVVYDQARRAYCFASLSADGSALTATDLLVGRDNPAALGLARHLRVRPEAARLQAQTRFARWDAGMEVTKRWKEAKGGRQLAESVAEDGPSLAPPSSTTTGTKVGLCLLIDFDDDPATVPYSEIIDFCNGDNYTGYGNNGSVKKYFLDNSKNLLTYTNVVTVYVRIPNSLHSKSYYNDPTKDAGSQANLLIRDAIGILKALPNYTTEILPSFNSLSVDSSGRVLACNVFYAGDNGGVWSYGLWPHSWSLYEVGAQELSSGGKKVFRYQVTNIGDDLQIGTFCHENGHMLCGFPDLYDYEYDSAGGAGNFCLMGYGGGDDSNPVQICAYLKRAAGWATTIAMTSGTALKATLTATVGAAGFNQFYRYVNPMASTEYFLFENRQKTGRDANIPGSGIAIWHIDEKGDRDNQSLSNNTVHANFECLLVQADNLWHLEKDPYSDPEANYGDANDLYFDANTSGVYSNAFSDLTAPNAHWWDGSLSSLEVNQFSAKGAVMTFIQPEPPTILADPVLPQGRVGSPYEFTFTAVNCSLPVWEVVSNAVPLGLNLSTNGVLSGIPEEATTAVFRVAVSGVNGKATTNEFSLTILPSFGVPFAEPFESAGQIPEGWRQEFVTNTVSWTYVNGNGSVKGYPSFAHGGDYNACLIVNEMANKGAVTRLCSPRISLTGGVHAAQLRFWHYMANYAGDQDQLKVLFKSAYTDEWTVLQTYTANVSAWTQRTIDLPISGTMCYIAFEGKANYGYGVHIDDVEIVDPTPVFGFTTSSPLRSAERGRAYSLALGAAGGTAPYTFALSGGALPDGITLDSDGVLSGTATTLGTNTFTVSLTDAEMNTVTADFTLEVVVPQATLFVEKFENGGVMPSGWANEYVTSNIPWRCQYGGGNGDTVHQPTNAVEGGYNAVLWVGSYSDHKTKLVSPEIDLGSAPVNLRLSFWHCMVKYGSDQDELRVFYKTSAGGAWNLLATYTNNVPTWTKRTLVLPNPSSTYYLGFEGNARFGYGVCIDDILISDETSAPLITTSATLPNGVVGLAYSQTLAAVGGVEPYAWSVASGALPPGLTLSSAGVLSGTPTAPYATPFGVRVTGADGYASTNTFTVRVTQTPGIPYTQNFDNGGAMPYGWTQEYPNGSLSWVMRSGSPYGVPSAPHSAPYNACLAVNNTLGYKTKLVSPMLNLGSGTPNTRLSFWLCMARYYTDQDELNVYYKTSTAGSWVSLASFKQSVPAWTNIVLDLPNPSPTYYIAFEGVAKYGYGVCVDDVSVTGDLSPYGSWKNDNFTEAELTAGLITGDNDDPDGDGIVNALEYAMGLDPRVADTTGVPFGGVTGGYLMLTYRENKEATDVRFEVESCTNLASPVWSTNGISEILRADSNLWWSVTKQHDVPAASAPQRFMRLKVYMP